MNQSLLKRMTPHLIALGVIVLLMVVYFYPMLGGKVLKQHDVVQWRASYQEIHKFQEETGERTFWTNSMFGGMPTYLIGPMFNYNFSGLIMRAVGTVFVAPMDTIFLLFICSYIMFLSFGISPWFAIGGAIAFTFSSFNLINIDAGHVTKGNAIAFMPLVMAGIQITLRKNKLLGGLVTGIGLALQLISGHLQITYYLAMLIVLWLTVELVIAIKNKTLPDLMKSGAVLLIAALFAVGSNSTSLLATEEYGKYSIRGKSELTKTPEGTSNESNQTGGLDKDYALQWSNGVSEVFMILIPNFVGGGSGGDPHSNELLTKHFKSENFPQAKELANSLPVYFGELPMTAGPIYFGAIVCFLFVFGMFAVKNPIKWWLFAISVLCIFLSMGKNFMALSDIFFDYVPLYNKFRSVNFILVIPQTTFPLLGLLGIKEMMTGDWQKRKDEYKKALLYSGGIVGGLCLLFMVFPDIASVSSLMDDRMKAANYPMDIIISGREKLRQADALRSFGFILVAFGLMWFYIQGKLKANVLAVALGVLILIDLWAVDKRFLNDRDYEAKKKPNVDVIAKTPVDEMILQDPDPHYRVYNTTQRLDQDAVTSYYHKSIGGYNGAKMRRYQELIEFQLAKGNMQVMNMLNVKYFIVSDSSGSQLFPQLNPAANGNAWFVKDVVMVDNADAEIDSLSHFNSKEKCFVDKRYADQLKDFKMSYDSTAKIKLTKYQPNKLMYQSEAAAPQLAVFSEIYYEKGWEAYVDGQPVPHFACDYVLRGMIVPAGKHEIEFRFDPKVVHVGESITLVSCILLYGGIFITGGFLIFRRKKEDEKQS